MDRRYNPSVPPVRPQRVLEGWMVWALVLGLAIGGAGLVATQIIIPAFDKVSTALEAAQKPAR